MIVRQLLMMGPTLFVAVFGGTWEPTDSDNIAKTVDPEALSCAHYLRDESIGKGDNGCVFFGMIVFVCVLA
jgi:hypothetical protein